MKLPPLIDTRRAPVLREVIGSLMSRAAQSDFAVHYVRIAALDLTAPELARVHCRLLLGRLNADQLADLHGDEATRRQLALLAQFLDSGRLEVRAAGLGRWAPDFSVHRGLDGADSEPLALIGTHQLGRTPAHAMVFATAVTGEAAQRLQRRFEVLWRQGHDVREVIRTELRAQGA